MSAWITGAALMKLGRAPTTWAISTGRDPNAGIAAEDDTSRRSAYEQECCSAGAPLAPAACQVQVSPGVSSAPSAGLDRVESALVTHVGLEEASGRHHAPVDVPRR